MLTVITCRCQITQQIIQLKKYIILKFFVYFQSCFRHFSWNSSFVWYFRCNILISLKTWENMLPQKVGKNEHSSPPPAFQAWPFTACRSIAEGLGRHGNIHSSLHARGDTWYWQPGGSGLTASSISCIVCKWCTHPHCEKALSVRNLSQKTPVSKTKFSCLFSEKLNRLWKNRNPTKITGCRSSWNVKWW